MLVAGYQRVISASIPSSKPFSPQNALCFCVTFREQLQVVSCASGGTRRRCKAAKRATAPSVAAPRADIRRHGLSEAYHHSTSKPALLKKVVEADKYFAPRGPKTEGSRRCGGGRDHPLGALFETDGGLRRSRGVRRRPHASGRGRSRRGGQISPSASGSTSPSQCFRSDKKRIGLNLPRSSAISAPSLPTKSSCWTDPSSTRNWSASSKKRCAH